MRYDLQRLSIPPHRLRLLHGAAATRRRGRMLAGSLGQKMLSEISRASPGVARMAEDAIPELAAPVLVVLRWARSLARAGLAAGDARSILGQLDVLRAVDSVHGPPLADAAVSWIDDHG